MKTKPEMTEGRKAFENFDTTMTALMKVPHSQIKAQLDAEKQEKERKRSAQKQK